MVLTHNLSDEEVIRHIYASNPTQNELLLISRFEKLLSRHDEALRQLAMTQTSLELARSDNASLESQLNNRPELMWAEGN